MTNDAALNNSTDATDPVGATYASDATVAPRDARSHLHLPGKHSRREFMRRSAMLAGAGVAAPWALDLAGLNAASSVAAAGPSGAAGAGDGYKALVCVFLYGGNDHNNTMVPYDTPSFDAYRAARGGIARDRNTLLPLDPINAFNDGRSIAFAPEWAGLKALFDQGDLATISNVGTLIGPLTKSGYANSSNRPPQLFSHNDQQSLWQSSAPEGAASGWGGRLADLLLEENGTDSVFTAMSLAGNAVMMTGSQAVQFQVSPSGPVTLDLNFGSDSVLTALQQVMRYDQGGLFPSAYSDITTRGLDAAARLGGAVDGAPSLGTAFPESALGSQLRMVSKLIQAGRSQLGLKRQVFFVAVGGFDNHNSIESDHPDRLLEVDAAISAFYDSTVEMGAVDAITTFTASDFGRTLVSNGNGSDHGWGGHHIVVGGSVLGQRNYGTLPLVADDGADDVGQGRLLPTTGVEQYASTLARWMGASGSGLAAVSPNIGRFDTDDLGFLGG